jgi:hypothetical protein
MTSVKGKYAEPGNCANQKKVSAKQGDQATWSAILAPLRDSQVIGLMLDCFIAVGQILPRHAEIVLQRLRPRLHDHFPVICVPVS